MLVKRARENMLLNAFFGGGNFRHRACGAICGQGGRIISVAVLVADRTVRLCHALVRKQPTLRLGGRFSGGVRT